MHRIDLENHFYTQEVLDVLTARESPPCYQKDEGLLTYVDGATIKFSMFEAALMDLADGRIQMMNRNGIDKAVISFTAGLEYLPVDIGIPLAKKINNALASAVKLHPDRFVGSAVLPVNDPPAACEELKRCVGEFGFVSWHVHSNFGESAPELEDVRYRQIFRTAEELGVYVYLHPAYSNDVRLKGYGISFNSAALGFTIDTMITMSRLILSGLLDEFPKLFILLGHLGEALPFLLDRMDSKLSGIPDPARKNLHPVSHYFKNGNILITTSGNLSKAAFLCAKEVVGIERILFATDYPYEDVGEHVAFVDSLPLSAKERQMVYSDNARRLLGA